MSLKHLSQTVHTIHFRLTLWYASLFIVSSIVLFGLIFLQYNATIKQRDHDVIDSQKNEYVSAYRQGGLGALRKLVADEKARGQISFVVRLVGKEGKVRFTDLPSGWPGYDFSSLDRSTKDFQWLKLHGKDDENPFEFAVQRMSDGALLGVGRSAENREDLIDRFQSVFWSVLLPVILLGFGAGMWLTSRTLRPIRHLIGSIQAILPSEHIGERVPEPKTQDELQQLVMLFNQMLGKNDLLIRGMREALDNVAHDLRTPMTRFRGKAEGALQDARPVVMKEALESNLEQSDHILQMLDTLMDISEAETGAMKLKLVDFHIAELLDEIAGVYRFLAEEKGVQLAISCSAELQLKADHARAGRAIANVIDNAIKYTLKDGQITVEAARQEREIFIRVTDTGTGIGSKDLPHIWDRLYRGDHAPDAKGLGLGLTLVKAIVGAHHGRITVSSKPGQGSTFTLYFPTR